MAGKRNNHWSEAKIKKYIKEGRGSGRLKEYLPWLRVENVKSRGLRSRQPGLKTGRLHHLMSNLEDRAFLFLDWDDRVIDIREGYPLDRELTRQIALEMDVRHPQYPGTKIDVVMTTDFLVDIQTTTGVKIVARTVKPLSELSDLRVLEKLEIERRYWAHKDIEWGIYTDVHLPVARAKNIWSALSNASFENEVEPYGGYWDFAVETFLSQLANYAELPLSEFFPRLEKHHGLEMNHGLKLFWHLAGRKLIRFDPDLGYVKTEKVATIQLLGVESATERMRHVATSK